MQRLRRPLQLAKVRRPSADVDQHAVHQMVPRRPAVALREYVLGMVPVAEEGRVPLLARLHAVPRPVARVAAVVVASTGFVSVIRRERILHVPRDPRPPVRSPGPVHVVVLRAPVLVQQRRLNRHLPSHERRIYRGSHRCRVAAGVYRVQGGEQSVEFVPRARLVEMFARRRVPVHLGARSPAALPRGVVPARRPSRRPGAQVTLPPVHRLEQGPRRGLAFPLQEFAVDVFHHDVEAEELAVSAEDDVLGGGGRDAHAFERGRG